MNLITINQLEQGGIQDANGNDSNGMSTRVRTLYLPVEPNATYKLITVSDIVVRGVHQYNSKRTWIKYAAATKQSYTFTTDESCGFIRVAFQRTNGNIALSKEEAIDEGKVTLTWNLEQSAAATPAAAATETSMNHKGQLITGNVLEGYSQAGIRNKGTVYSNELIEF